MSGSALAPTASPARTAAAAAGALAVSIELLVEAARLGVPTDTAAAEERRRIGAEADALLARLPRPPALGDEPGPGDAARFEAQAHTALADCALIAREVAHLAEFLASCDKRPCGQALAAARLAETAAQMVVEAAAEEAAGSTVDTLSRRARQIVEIHEIETRLDAAVARLAAGGITGSIERRTFRHSKAPKLTDADWDA